MLNNLSLTNSKKVLISSYMNKSLIVFTTTVMFVCVLVYAKSNLVTVDSELENNKKIEMHNSVEETPEVFFDPEYIRGYQEGYHALLENPYNRNPMFDENSSDAFKEGFLEGKDKAILDYGDIKLGFASK